MYLLLIYSLNTYMVCVRAHACAQAWHTCGQRTTLTVVFFSSTVGSGDGGQVIRHCWQMLFTH